MVIVHGQGQMLVAGMVALVLSELAGILEEVVLVQVVVVFVAMLHLLEKNWY